MSVLPIQHHNAWDFVNKILKLTYIPLNLFPNAEAVSEFGRISAEIHKREPGKCKVCDGVSMFCETNDCPNYRQSIECNPECHESCRNRKYERKLFAQTYISETLDKGYGLFAAQDICKYDLVVEYVGQVVKDCPDDYFSAPLPNTGLYIDTREFRNEAAMINHSCLPNSSIDYWCCNDGNFRILITAIKDIPKGTEITISYGDNVEFEGTACRCNEPVCVHHVQPNVIPSVRQTRSNSHTVTQAQLEPELVNEIKCPDCGGRFASSYGLERHIKFNCPCNEPLNSFKCPNKGCSEKFKRRDDANHHAAMTCKMQNDKVKSNFVCRKCQEKFGSKKDLDRHVAFHCLKIKNKITFPCPYKKEGCPLTYTREYKAKAHAKTCGWQYVAPE